MCVFVLFAMSVSRLLVVASGLCRRTVWQCPRQQRRRAERAQVECVEELDSGAAVSDFLAYRILFCDDATATVAFR